jgi:AraC-like DNA-binding protein
MKIVAVFFSDETTTRRLTLAFRNRCAVREFADFESARRLITAEDVLALIVDMRRRIVDPSKLNATDLIAHIHAAWPTVPVVGYVDFTPERARDIFAAARAGATEIILGDLDDLDIIANKIVDIGMSSDTTTRVELVLNAVVPIHLRDFFLLCMANARHAMTVENMVARTGRSRKTLSNWLAAAQLPPPSRIIGWTRVLVAARMLDDTTQSAEKIARELHFMSGTALRNMMRRYLGCGPDVLRKRGGFEYALSEFLNAITVKKNTHHEDMAGIV